MTDHDEPVDDGPVGPKPCEPVDMGPPPPAGHDVTPPRSPVVIACADLVARTGGRFFQVGYLHDDRPSHLADWYAHAQYKGRRVIVEGRRSPEDACERLAHQLLVGARDGRSGNLCSYCRKPITIGRPHPAQCRWTREGDRWARGCRPPLPEGVTCRTGCRRCNGDAMVCETHPTLPMGHDGCRSPGVPCRSLPDPDTPEAP